MIYRMGKLSKTHITYVKKIRNNFTLMSIDYAILQPSFDTLADKYTDAVTSYH